VGRLKLVRVHHPLQTGRTQQIWPTEIEREDDGKMVARWQLRVQNLPAMPERRD
jgi:hypothetical protein